MCFLPRGLLVSTLLLIYAIGCMTENEGNDGNPFTTLMETLPPPAINSPLPFSKTSPVFPILTRVLNAFPLTERDGSEVSVILEEDKVEGVRYGSVIEKQTMMHSMEDFVIVFSNHTKEVMVDKAVGYGYIDGEVGRDEEVLVIVRRSKTNPQEPEYDIKHFTTKLSNNTSNVYLYNAIWNTRNDLGGLNFYGVKRVTGEPVPLARGLAMGEGQEITLPPGTTMAVKASHADLESSDVFDIAQTVASISELHTVAGKRHYIIAFGDQSNEFSSTRAVLVQPTADDATADAVSSDPGVNPTLCGLAVAVLSVISLRHT